MSNALEQAVLFEKTQRAASPRPYRFHDCSPIGASTDVCFTKRVVKYSMEI